MRDFDIAGALDFNGDQPFGPAEFGIRINQDRQNMPVDDVDQSVAVRDDLYLIPLAGFDNRFEFVRGAQVSEQSWLLSRFGGPGSRQDSTWRACDHAPALPSTVLVARE